VVGDETSDSDLSSYLYAEDDPTLLTDPSGLDPRFSGKTLSCGHNSYLCRLVYAVGYRDGCKGQRLYKALVTLAGRGIDFNYLYAAAIGKGKIVNVPDGPKGPGIYFVKYGDRSYLIKPPSSPTCGLACALGKGTTVALGCNSTLTCGIQGALIVLPGITEARAAARAEVAGEEAVAAARGAEAAAEGARAAEAGASAFGGLSRADEYGIQSYSQLARELKGTGLQAHHLIEQRFAGVMDESARQMESIAVTPAEHQMFTNAWRKLIPYGEKGTGQATRGSVLNAARDIYAKYPAITKALNLS
jgi:hypothetical protein